MSKSIAFLKEYQFYVSLILNLLIGAFVIGMFYSKTEQYGSSIKNLEQNCSITESRVSHVIQDVELLKKDVENNKDGISDIKTAIETINKTLNETYTSTKIIETRVGFLTNQKK